MNGSVMNVVCFEWSVMNGLFWTGLFWTDTVSALPAMISTFNSNMRQNDYYRNRNLKVEVDLSRCAATLLLRNKKQ